MSGILILRPQPGADSTARRARALGLRPVVAPLFAVRALAWETPSASAYDAVMLTSANAAHFAGDALAPFLDLPCYAVGARTAAEGRAVGFSNLRIGPGNGANLLAMMAADGVRHVFHPCGRDHIAALHPNLTVVRLPVYVSETVDRLPGAAAEAIENDAVVLLHSPRAASAFADLAGDRRDRVRIVAISPAAAEAAGPGWRAVEVAAVPRDQPLLELAAQLCQRDG